MKNFVIKHIESGKILNEEFGFNELVDVDTHFGIMSFSNLENAKKSYDSFGKTIKIGNKNYQKNEFEISQL